MELKRRRSFWIWLASIFSCIDASVPTLVDALLDRRRGDDAPHPCYVDALKTGRHCSSSSGGWRPAADRRKGNRRDGTYRRS